MKLQGELEKIRGRSDLIKIVQNGIYDKIEKFCQWPEKNLTGYFYEIHEKKRR